MRKSIGYHTRLWSDHRVKTSGGSFGGCIDQDTIERLVKAHFTAVVKPSGSVVFVDRAGREVSLYVSVDASDTTIGKAALAVWQKEQDKKAEREIEKQDEIERLLDELSSDEIMSRLKG